MESSVELGNAQVLNNNEQQRRNKKRKPPNYYQSAEYAAIIKHADGLAQLQQQSQSNHVLSNTNNDENTNSPTALSSSSQNVTINEIDVSLNNLNLENPTQSLQNEDSSPAKSGSEISTVTTTNTNTASISSESNSISSNEDQTDSAISKPINDSKKTPESSASSAGAAWGSSSNKISWSSLFTKTEAANSNSTVATNSSKVSAVAKNGNNKQTSESLPVVNNSHAHLNGNWIQAENNSSSKSVLRSLGTLFKDYQLKHSAPALKPRGIRNKQNWCYVNATLQALLACPPFYNLIKTVYASIKSTNAAGMAQVPFLSALGRYVSEFKARVRSESSSSKVNNSSTVLTVNGKELVIGEPFDIDYFYDTLMAGTAETTNEMQFGKSGRQEDAQELLTFLLNRLHDEMVRCLDTLNVTGENNGGNLIDSAAKVYSKENGKANAHENHTVDSNNSVDDADDWKEVGKKNRAYVTRKAAFKQSPLSDIFCGQFRSALSQLGVKDKESVSLEPFFTIPLDIQVKYAVFNSFITLHDKKFFFKADTIKTVNQALEHFVQKEELFGFTHQETKQEVKIKFL